MTIEEIYNKAPYPEAHNKRTWTEGYVQCFLDLAESEQLIDRTEEAYNKGYNDGIAANLADLEKQWKHGYDFAKKEMKYPGDEDKADL